MTAYKRIMGTPLIAIGTRVHVAADKYHVATVSSGMNDAEDYARIFASVTDLIEALESVMRYADPWAVPQSREGFDNVAAHDKAREVLLHVKGVTP